MLLNADYLIVSRATDPATLGIYLLAFNVSSWPLTTITDAVRRVSIAGFAKMEDQAEALKARFSSSLSTLLTAALPMIVAMALLATPLIGFLYGDQWLPSAPVLQVLVVLSFARMAIGFIFDLLVGVGRTRVTMALKVVWLVVLVPALMYGVRADDIQGVAIAHALVAGLVALPLFAARGATGGGRHGRGDAPDGQAAARGGSGRRGRLPAPRPPRWSVHHAGRRGLGHRGGLPGPRPPAGEHRGRSELGAGPTSDAVRYRLRHHGMW